MTTRGTTPCTAELRNSTRRASSSRSPADRASLYTDRLPYEAGVAVAFGLPEEEAIKAVTINAAEFMGLSDRLGSLEVGKQATLLITTGTPIDTRSDVLQAYIQGKEIDMIDIQKHFFLKYMEKLKQKLKIIS